jgi:hypothetical protein
MGMVFLILAAGALQTGCTPDSAAPDPQGTLPLAAPPGPNSSLYAANLGNSTVEEYAYSNGRLSSMGTTFDNRATDQSDPSALAFDRAGDLYVANKGGGINTIEEFAYSKGSLHSAGTVFTTNGLKAPYGLAFGSASAPEPSQFAALGIGALGLGGLRLCARRRKSSPSA